MLGARRGISAGLGCPISIGVVWGGVLIVAFLYAPEAEFFASPHEGGAARARFRARDVWPRLSDYWASLMLLAIPAIALPLVIMAMRRAPTASRQRSTLSISGRWGGRHNKSTRLNQTATVWLVRGLGQVVLFLPPPWLTLLVATRSSRDQRVPAVTLPPATDRQAAQIAWQLVSMSCSVVGAEITDNRITQRSRQRAPPAKQVPSAWRRRIVS